MEEKRYSIVRVDMNYCIKCEHYYTNKDGNNDCRLRRGASFLCDRHGDTKEQMIKKITTVLRREKIKRGLTYYWLATKIVEFLGVE